MIKILLMCLIALTGCSQKISETGKHYCSNGVLNYRLEVLAGKNKGTGDSANSLATDVSLEVQNDGHFTMYYKVNGLPQSMPSIQYKTNGTKLSGSDSEEEVVTDPSTNKKWIRQRNYELTVDSNSGDVKRTITENHMDINKSLSSTESYILNANCK